MECTRAWISLAIGFILRIGATQTEPLTSALGLEATHISLNAIQLTWNLDSGNKTETESYQLAVAATPNGYCDEPDMEKTLDATHTEWVFWDVKPRAPYLACGRRILDGKPGNWSMVQVGVDAAEPPLIVDFGVIRHHPVAFGELENTYYFLPYEEVGVRCQTRGAPTPNITWYWNGEPRAGHELSGAVTSEGDLLTSVIYVADDHRTGNPEGVYKCVASNQYGKALSARATLLEAVLETFPVNEQDRDYWVAVGDCLEITCRAPFSRPKASFSWYKITSREDRNPVPVQEDHRIRIIKNEGSLLFLSTTLADEGMYRCDAYNPELDMEETGCYSNLKFTSRQTNVPFPPILLYRSDSYIPALVGRDAVLTCIYGGKPTPSVFWYRQGDFPTSRHVFGDNNHTLTIKDVREEDEGQYECSGYSQRQQTNKEDFQLRVYAAPEWVERPQSVNATVGDDVTFVCEASGILEPEIQWFINGETLQGSSVKTAYSLNPAGTQVTFYNVSKQDLMNIHCNASNTHGFVHAGASLNVLLPTQILETPEDVVLYPNDVIKFGCKVKADPGTLLTVTWLRGGEPISVFEEDRIYMTSDHSLVINMTNEMDGGNSFLTTYTCVADNEISKVTASARLMPLTQASILSEPVLVRNKSSYTDLLWIGLTCGLVAVLIICLLLLLAARKKQAQLSRSNADNSILTYLSGANRGDQTQEPRVTYQGLAVEENGLLGLPFVDDQRLQEALQEVFIPRARIDLGNLVGKGQFGRVYAGVLRDRDQRRKITNRIAVKTLKYKADESEIVELFLREALMMKDFRHAHVLRLIGISVAEDGSPMVILPFMSHGDLRKFIQDPAKEITVLELLKMGLQVAKGMVYLGNMRFVHRDLAARNCMVDSNKIVKVADFGLSRDLFCRDYYRIGDGKTPLPVRWMAPESLESSVFTTQSDVWSFGVLLWELMTRGAVPYPDVDNWDIGHYIQTGKRLAQPLYCPDSVFEIMQSCWEDRPDDRPSFEIIVKEIEAIVNSAKTVGPASSHLYLNISTMTSFTDYRECSV